MYVHTDVNADLQVVELSSASGLTLTFVEKGLHVTSIKFKDGQGKEHDIIIGSDDPAHYVDQKAVSATWEVGTLNG